jgi:hypothetical protein
MPQSAAPNPQPYLEAATDEAIAACGGNARHAVKALIVAEPIFGSASGRTASRRLEWLRAGQI